MSALSNTIPALLTVVFSSLFVTAFGQEDPKDIYELFDLKKGGCGLEVLSEPILIEEVAEDYPIGFQQKEREDFSLEEIRSWLSGLSEKEYTIDQGPEKIKLANGNTLFLKNQKWGLKNEKGKTIIKPVFDQVYRDTIAGSFSGYTKAQCNYYDEQGIPLLAESYYHIQAVGQTAFVVRSAKGYGLIVDGKEIIAPNMGGIKKEISNDRIYYKVNPPNKGDYILLDDLETEIPMPFWDKAHFIGEDHVKMTNNLVNLKSAKCLICEKGYEFSILDEENQIAGFNKIGQRFWYLIDFEGNLLTTKKFYYFRKFNDQGTAIAGIRNPNNGPFQISGLIDHEGNWVLEPIYHNLYEAGNYIIGHDADRNVVIYDKKGMPLTTKAVRTVLHIKEDRIIITPVTGVPGAENFEPYILNLKTGKQETIGVKFSRIRPKQFCNKNVYVATQDKEEMMLDENFKPLTGIHQRIFTADDRFIIGSSINKETRQRAKAIFDCEGEAITFEINGKKESIVSEFKYLDEGLYFITLQDETNYLIKEGNPPVEIPYYINYFGIGRLGDLFIANSYQLDGVGVINSQGETVVPYEFESISPFHPETGMSIMKISDKKEILVSAKGEIFRNEIFEGIRYVGNGYYALQKNKKYGLFDLQGQQLLPFEYDYIILSNGLINAYKAKRPHFFDLLINEVE